MPQTERIVKADNSAISNIFGQFDENISRIEKELSVRIVNRSDGIKIVGEEENCLKAEAVVEALVEAADKGEKISSQSINYMVNSSGSELKEVGAIYDDCICLTVNGRPVKPKTIGQKKYVDMIRNNTITFGIGPAGTGKTYLAMAMAITAFKNNEVNRIIMTRPAIEAGEKLGFLPGDLQLLEVAPLAYMRGRTLDNAFIVLDEAQNTTPEQMKMFLTRIGYGSKAVVTGDLTQIDLVDGRRSGLMDAVRILKDVEDLGIITLTNKDVVRHPLVQKIIAAYEKAENKKRDTDQGRKNR